MREREINVGIENTTQKEITSNISLYSPGKLINWTCRTYEEVKYAYKILLGKIRDADTYKKEKKQRKGYY